MKLAEALRLGYDCGMKTVDDCIYNVHLHAMNLFAYDKMAAEEAELNKEYRQVLRAVEVYGVTPTTSTEEAMDLLKVEYKPDVDTEAYPQCK